MNFMGTLNWQAWFVKLMLNVYQKIKSPVNFEIKYVNLLLTVFPVLFIK
jgi:hypothetical protein